MLVSKNVFGPSNANTCFAHNVQYDKHGNTPWLARRKNAFTGKLLPFGVLVDFLPSPIAGELPKFSPRAVPGLFMGWRVMANGTWRNEYHVVSMSQLDSAHQGRRLELQTVREVYQVGDFVFPQRTLYEQLRRIPQPVRDAPIDEQPPRRPEVDEMELILGPDFRQDEIIPNRNSDHSAKYNIFRILYIYIYIYIYIYACMNVCMYV
jgi:hypothetical protein